MNDLQDSDKKGSKVVTCFRWFFIVIFSLLLLIGLVFQAPLKVAGLLAVLLATITVVGKLSRKWVWLGFALVIISLIVWVFLPDDDTGWRPYTLDEELAALETKRAVPDEQNAAIIYSKLLESYDGYRYLGPDFSNLNREDFEDPNFPESIELFSKNEPPNTFYPGSWNDELDKLTLNQPWSSNDHPELAKWLKDKHGNTINNLMQANERKYCRFPMTIDLLRTESTNRMFAMMAWAQLLVRAANNDIGDDRTDLAVQKYTCVIKMASLVTSYDMIMGLGIARQRNRCLREFVVNGDLPIEQLNILEKGISGSKFDWTSSLLEIESMKIQTKASLITSYEVNKEGKVRLSRYAGPNEIEKEFNIEVQETYQRKKCVKAGCIFAWFWLPSSPEKMVRIIDERFERLYAMCEPDFDWDKGPEGFSFSSIRLNFSAVVDMLLYIIEPSYYKIHDAYLRGISDNRATQIVFHLRRYKDAHGYWPQSLEEIKATAPAEIFIDIVNDGEFMYKLTEDSFTLYSKGKNNIDDQGQRKGKTEKDDFLFWPQKLPEKILASPAAKEN